MYKLTDPQTKQILNAADKFIRHLRNVPDLTPDQNKELITEFCECYAHEMIKKK
jgi:hypothetical protein